MAHLFQVGAGSGGIVVLDLVCRDPKITRITLVEPDVYEAHNVHRHLFPASAVGRKKVELAAEWLRERRPDLQIDGLCVDLTDPAHQTRINAAVAACDLGVCAADNEEAKFHFDRLMRANVKPWTLGEVLSGGIGGWVHRFASDGPCYGCVASYLKRSGPSDTPNVPPADYSQPNAAVAETRIPASRASIATIAGLHAIVTLALLEPHDWTSMLLTLQQVPGVFDEAFRPHRFRIPKSLSCLICSIEPVTATGEELDVALDQALARLGHE